MVWKMESWFLPDPFFEKIQCFVRRNMESHFGNFPCFNCVVFTTARPGLLHGISYHMLKYLGLWLPFCTAKWRTKSGAANSLAMWILELTWNACIECNVLGDAWGNFSREQINVVEIISCNCFSDCNVWFGLTGADAKIFAQTGSGTTTGVEVYRGLGSHTWWTLGNHDAEN